MTQVQRERLKCKDFFDGAIVRVRLRPDFYKVFNFSSHIPPYLLSAAAGFYAMRNKFTFVRIIHQFMFS